MEFRRYFTVVTETAKKERKSDDDFIGEDGLAYCCKCRTPKQTRVKFPWGDMMPYIPCECEKAEKLKEEEERKEVERLYKREIVRTHCFPDGRMEHMTFANDDGANEKVTSVAKRYCDNFAKLDGKGLLLYGSTGTGKTYAACEIANELIDQGYTARMTSFDRIIRDLFDCPYKAEYIRELLSYNLLIIDDLGAERGTSYALETVYSIINERTLSKKPLIITTNLSMEEIKAPSNIECKRIYDRILEACFPLEVAGVNHRRKNIIDGYNEMKDILGL